MDKQPFTRRETLHDLRAAANAALLRYPELTLSAALRAAAAERREREHANDEVRRDE
jgi:hypothetical protein